MSRFLASKRSPILATRAARARGVWGSLFAALLLSLAVSGCADLSAVRGGYTPAWELPPPPARIAPVVVPGTLTRLSLDNGLSVLVLEDHRLPTAQFGLSVRRGAGSVAPESAGLAELTAELMNRGAAERDALALATAVDEMGASLSVSAGWDSMRVSVSGLSRDSNELMNILRDVVLEPRLAADEAAKARAEQLASLEAARDSTGTLVRWQAMETLYQGHRYGLPMSGSPETVAGLSAEAARRLHSSYFVPNNAIVYAVGDIEASVWLEQVKQAFGAWEGGVIPAAAEAPQHPSPAERRIVVVDKPDQVQARIIIAHEGLARTDDRRIAAGLLNDTLGGSGFSSRMMKTLRSNAGLTYSVGSGFSLRRQPGPFSVSTFTRVTEARRAVDILLSELEIIRGSQPQTQDELAKSKSYNVGQFGLGLETSRAVLGSLVNLQIYGLPEDSLDTYRSRVQEVTPLQIQGVATDLIHPERAAIVLLGPAESLVPQFEDLGSVEVVQP